MLISKPDFPQPLAATSLFFASVSVSILDASYRWIHAVEAQGHLQTPQSWVQGPLSAPPLGYPVI